MRFRLEMIAHTNHNIVPHNRAYYEVGPEGNKEWYINMDGMSELANFVTDVGGEVMFSTSDNSPYPTIKLTNYQVYKGKVVL